jgi:NAD(P)-dependent dehydrogenase (short-subunit alcohol dehydrogenase family)
MRGLGGKVAVVVGGAGGIGTATCTRLAEEGCAVALGDLDVGAAAEVAEKIRSSGGQALARETDIGDDEQVRALIDEAAAELGGVDIVHANAADLSPEAIGCDSDAVDIPLEAFDRTMRAGARGHLLCARHGIPRLLERGGGALVFTSSGAAFAGEPQRPAYAMSKSAINALVRHIASRWGKEGIRANGVAPGLVRTEKNFAILDEEHTLELVLSTIRSPRVGKPEDVAAMVAFLASDDGEWINGQVIAVDGGTTMR